MSFTRPTLAELIERVVTSIDTSLDTASAKLRRSNLNVLAKVLAATAHGLYGFIAWVAAQILPDTCSEEILERYAKIWLTTPRIPAEFASGTMTVTGTAGSVVEVGTVYKRADGQRYEVTAERILTASSGVVAIAALEPGQDGNADAGVVLSAESPITGVQSSAVVLSLDGGADQESVAALRTRVLERIRKTPMAGAKYDYVRWALEVPGVTRAWSYPKELASNNVTVRFMRDNDADPFPNAAEVAAVQAYIDEQAPVTAEPIAMAPIAQPVNYVIALDPDLSTVRTAVEAELRDLHLREAVPGGTLLLSHMREAISIASGENNHILHSPAADVTCLTGRMATFGGITWSET